MDRTSFYARADLSLCAGGVRERTSRSTGFLASARGWVLGAVCDPDALPGERGEPVGAGAARVRAEY